MTHCDRADDAQGFFDQSNRAMKEMESQLVQPIVDNPSPPSKEHFRSKAQRHKREDQISFKSLAGRIFMESSVTSEVGQSGDFDRSAQKKLPRLPRKNFIHLWQTLQEFCEFSSFCNWNANGGVGESISESKDAMLYDSKDTLLQSVTMVGTLLLQIGEVGQRLKNSRSRSVEENDVVDEGSGIGDGVDHNTNSRQMPKSSVSMHQIHQQPTVDEDDWSITFEQFLASILNENSLVGAFDQKIDVAQRLLEQDRPVAATKSATGTTNTQPAATSSAAKAQSEFYV